MSDNNSNSKQKQSADGLGVDDLVEDIFGLNWRGLKTIWTLFTRPALYFEAAKTPKWQDRYTPSFRV